jgi:hypothetical protein
MQYPFGLDPSSRKYTCPQCKQKTLVAYLDNESGQPVDQYQYGRCDRENNCGYHHAPWMDQEYKHKSFTPKPDPETVYILPPLETIEKITKRTKTCVSPLHKFCNKLTISNEHLLRFGVYSDENKTVYVFRDQEGTIVNLKWFKYKEDGHRDKDFKSFSLKTPPVPPQSKESEKIVVEKYRICLFGEHLLDKDKARVVAIVESEKTAAIASFFYPQFDWVSCASNNGLTDSKIQALHNRTVYWLCDADPAGRKNKSIERATAYLNEFYVVDLFPDRNDGYDIADAIVDGLRPEIKPTYKPSERAKEVKVENADAYEYDLPKGCDFETVKWDIRKYMHFEHEGKIFIVRKRKGTNNAFGEEKGIATFFCSNITNFTIRPLGLIASETEPTRLVEIKNIHGFSQVVKVPTKAFASPTEFTVFMESVGNFQYDGVGTDLKKIRAKLYDDMHTFEEVQNLGWHSSTGYFLWANGAYNGKFSPIDKYGFVKLGDRNFFIQPLSCIHRDDSEEEWQDEKKFIYKERKDVTLKQWSELFCKVHKDNGRIALAWYITSLFRDFIYQRFKFFPHLFLFGPPGTGKSQVGWSIRATGYIGLVKPFNLNTGTAVAFHREFSHFRNFPAWCDEYDNSIPFERIQALKAAYDGVGHKKSVKDSDKRTKSTQVNRAIMISGQQLPIADNALFKRVILLQFTQTEFSEEEQRVYRELLAMEDGGLTHITAGFMHFRAAIEKEYLDTFDGVLDDVMKSALELNFEVEDRIARNSAIILTTIKVLEKQIADRLPYNYEQLKQVVMSNMKEQMSLISNTNETNSFWDIVMYLSRDRKGVENGRTIYAINEGEDFCFESKGRITVLVNGIEQVRELSSKSENGHFVPKEVLFIRFSKIIHLYKEAFKRQSSSTASPMDKASLMHYLHNSKPFLGTISKYNFKDSRTSCYAFDYDMLKSMGIYLGGSERNDGGPPPPVQAPEPAPRGTSPQASMEFSKTPVNASKDDLPF